MDDDRVGVIAAEKDTFFQALPVSRLHQAMIARDENVGFPPVNGPDASATWRPTIAGA